MSDKLKYFSHIRTPVWNFNLNFFKIKTSKKRLSLRDYVNCSVILLNIALHAEKGNCRMCFFSTLKNIISSNWWRHDHYSLVFYHCFVKRVEMKMLALYFMGEIVTIRMEWCRFSGLKLYCEKNMMKIVGNSSVRYKRSSWISKQCHHFQFSQRNPFTERNSKCVAKLARLWRIF